MPVLTSTTDLGWCDAQAGVMMKRVVLALVLGLGGCSVGKGVGAASGYIYEYGCTKNGDYGMTPDGGGSEKVAAAYDLKPTFFAGEPIDDLREYSETSAIMSNRLIIRLQRSGKRMEIDDVLTFDVVSSYEVARCVRGHVDAATGNDWDEANCFRASDYGPGRMRVQWDAPVHASLILQATCTPWLANSTVSATPVASAVSSTPVPISYASAPAVPVANGAWDSWVEFQDFGSARQDNLAPADREPVNNKFRVDYGQRVYATTFFLTLVDENLVSSAINNRPRPESAIGGTLGGDPTTGRFDFDVQRGQGAQFFP